MRPMALWRVAAILLCSSVICASAGLIAHTHGVVRRAWAKTPLTRWAPARGLAWEAELDAAWHRTPKNPYRLSVLEDGVPLPQQTFELDEIRDGRGFFGILGGRVFLSTSDGSDPRTNKKRYEIYWPGPLDPATARAVHDAAELCSILLILLVLHGLLGHRFAADARDVAGAARALAARWRELILPGSRWGWTALVLFLAIALSLTRWYTPDRSGWVRYYTSPGINSSWLLGYNLVNVDEAFHKENYSTFKQVLLFCGVMVQRDFSFMRGMYSFAVSLFVPLIPMGDAMLLTNFLAWGLCAWSAFRLCRTMYADERAGLIAVLLVAGGMGPAVHIRDRAAHLLGHAMYFLGCCVLFESRVWKEERPWDVHLLIGAFLAVASLTYTGCISLAIVYVILACPFNRWRHIAGATLFPLAARPVWQLTLSLAGPGVSYNNLEALQVGLSLRYWWSALAGSPATFPALVLRYLVDFVSFDSPLVVLGGFAAILCLVRPAKLLWFHVVFLAIPLAGMMAGAVRQTARGYLLYGLSLPLCAALAYALSSGMRRPATRLIAIPATVLALLFQFGWSTALQANCMGPLLSYMYGYARAVPLFEVGHCDVFSLTGHEPTPEVFGGQSSLPEAGLPDLSGTPVAATPGVGLPPRFTLSECPAGVETHFGWMVHLIPAGLSIPSSLLCRAPFVAAIALLMFAWCRVRRVPSRQTALWIEAFVLGTCVLSVAAALWPKQVPTLADLDHVLWIRPGGSFRYTVRLAPDVVERFRRELKEGESLEVFMAVLPQTKLFQLTPRLTAGATTLPPFVPGSTSWEAADARRVLDALARSPELTIEIPAPHEAVGFGAWQRAGLAGRTLQLVSPYGDPPPPFVPDLELRLESAPEAPRLIAF